MLNNSPNSNLTNCFAVTIPSGPRCPALPVADEAGHKRVQRSARDEGVFAEDIRRVPQTGWEVTITDQPSTHCLRALPAKFQFVE